MAKGRLSISLYNFWGALGVILGHILLVLGGIFLVIFLMRYLLSVFLFVNDEESKPGALVRKSVRYMKGRCADAFVFGLSFLGWGLLSLLVLPILYVAPYLFMSFTLYAVYLIELNLRKEEAEKNYTREFENEPDSGAVPDEGVPVPPAPPPDGFEPTQDFRLS